MKVHTKGMQWKGWAMKILATYVFAVL
jgi:hypothetical protein